MKRFTRYEDHDYVIVVLIMNGSSIYMPSTPHSSITIEIDVDTWEAIFGLRISYTGIILAGEANSVSLAYVVLEPMVYEGLVHGADGNVSLIWRKNRDTRNLLIVVVEGISFVVDVAIRIVEADLRKHPTQVLAGIATRISHRLNVLSLPLVVAMIAPALVVFTILVVLVAVVGRVVVNVFSVNSYGYKAEILVFYD